MVSGNDCNAAIRLNHRTTFSKVSRLFSHIMQRVLLLLLQGCFKKARTQFKCNNVIDNEDKEH